MSRVVPALKTNDTLRMIGKPVDDFAFALVAPLTADHYYVFCHRTLCAICSCLTTPHALRGSYFPRRIPGTAHTFSTTHLPLRSTSFRLHPSSSRDFSWPGR